MGRIVLNTFIDTISHSADETVALGQRLGRLLPPSTVITFEGELGAGKTTMVKGIVSGATETLQTKVNSPTFVYLKSYEGKKPVHHFDLYRLHEASEFLHMGFDDLFCAGGLCCIEWSEKITDLIPSDALRIVIAHAGEKKRHIRVQGRGHDPFSKS